MSPDLFLKLAVLSLSKEQMEGVVDVLKCMEAEHEAKVEKSREKARARLQKWRDKPENVSKRFKASQNVLKPLTQADDAPDLENKQTNKQENKKTSRASDEAAFRAELAPDLSPELLDGIIKVRRDKRGQVTGLAARCFRDDAAECGMSIHDAAKACVTSSWITVKPHYFHSRAGPVGRKRNFVDAAMDRINGHGSESIFGGNGDAERLSTGRSEPRSDVADVRSGLSRQFVRGGH